MVKATDAATDVADKFSKYEAVHEDPADQILHDSYIEMLKLGMGEAGDIKPEEMRERSRALNCLQGSILMKQAKDEHKELHEKDSRRTDKLINQVEKLTDKFDDN